MSKIFFLILRYFAFVYRNRQNLILLLIIPYILPTSGQTAMMRACERRLKGVHRTWVQKWVGDGEAKTGKRQQSQGKLTLSANWNTILTRENLFLGGDHFFRGNTFHFLKFISYLFFWGVNRPEGPKIMLRIPRNDSCHTPWLRRSLPKLNGQRLFAQASTWAARPRHRLPLGEQERLRVRIPLLQVREHPDHDPQFLQVPAKRKNNLQYSNNCRNLPAKLCADIFNQSCKGARATLSLKNAWLRACYIMDNNSWKPKKLHNSNKIIILSIRQCIAVSERHHSSQKVIQRMHRQAIFFLL